MSAESRNIDLDIAPVATGAAPELAGGAELAALSLALTTRTGTEPTDEREALIAAIGAAGAERAVGVCATFQMMNRLLDGVGAPVHPTLHPLAQELGFAAEEITR